MSTGDSPFSGFCLYDSNFPIIYVNNNNAKSRQIFTLFHELAHLLMDTGGIDTRQDNYIEHMTGDDRRIEVLCNLFAAEFLVPSRDFEARLAGVSIDDRAIENWASLYCVSRETILRRLLDQGRVRQQDYEQKVQQWSMEQTGSKGVGGNYYLTKGAFVKAIFEVRHFQAMIRKKERLQGGSVADPFVVARAKCLENGCVVTTEKTQPQCRKNSECFVSILGLIVLFMEREKWRF